MKKISLLFIALGLIFVSCSKDGGESKEDLNEGAIPNITKISTTDQGLNVVALNAGQGINLGLNIGIGFGNVASMDIVGIYSKGAVLEKAILKTNLATFPTTVNITQTDLYNAFNILNSASDVGLKDNLVISADLKMKDGTVVKMYNANGTPNYGSGIANLTGIKVFQTYIVSCPLTNASLFNGNYKVVTDDWEDYPINNVVPVVYNATNGIAKFRIMNSANPSTISSSSTNYLECTLNTTTATVTVVSNAPYLYGAGVENSYTVAGTGNVSSCTGNINLILKWTKSSGSFADQKFNLVKI